MITLSDEELPKALIIDFVQHFVENRLNFRHVSTTKISFYAQIPLATRHHGLIYIWWSHSFRNSIGFDGCEPCSSLRLL